MPKLARAVLLATTLLALPIPASADTPDYAAWDQYLGGADSSQYSALEQITPANVALLEVAWEYPTGEGAGYAGGILSAAVDGIRVAEAVAMSITAGAGRYPRN